MVHCISSSEPDTGDNQATPDDWRLQGITTKEITLNQMGQNGKTFVESTVTTGIQVGKRPNVDTYLTLTDMNQQQADTTHHDYTNEPLKNMDTTIINHSQLSNTLEHSNKDLINNKKFNNHLTNSFSMNNSYSIDPNHKYNNNKIINPDHLDYTLTMKNKNSIINNDIKFLHDNKNHSHNYQLHDNHIKYNHADLYPHLYNLPVGTNNRTINNYQTNQPIIHKFVTNQFSFNDNDVYDNEDDDSETSIEDN